MLRGGGDDATLDAALNTNIKINMVVQAIWLNIGCDLNGGQVEAVNYCSVGRE